MALYDRIADLPLAVENIAVERRERDTSSGFTRVTTVVTLRGDGHAGRGEDVTYDAADHDTFREWIEGGADLDLAGEHTFDSFTDYLAEQSLAPEPIEDPHARNYRRWAFDSAALDLALRQAGANLGAALDREYDPVRFVASTRLGEPPTADRVHAILDAVPGTEFKLDPTVDWTPALATVLAETDAVRVLDLKGVYEGTTVDNPPDPDLYELVAETFSDAVIEDPALTDATRPIVESVADRLSWDFPVTDTDSLREREDEVGAAYCNVKPSRIGSVEATLDLVEYARERGIELYGGGQFELDVGRGQIQALASLCYPDGPNDVAPGAYNDPDVPDDLPASPLDPQGGPDAGFGLSR